MSYFRDNIISMPPYVPGEQPPAGSSVIKLNTNENPYPPSPKVIEAMAGFDPGRLRLYSDPMSTPVRMAAAEVFNMPPDWILVGNGSDDLLAMIVLACTGAGRPIAYAMPTYTLYRTLAQMQQAPLVELEYTEDYRLPADELIKADAAVTFVASPNSPSGTLAPTNELDRLARGLNGLLVIDEAYCDFAAANALELVKTRGNTVVLRTLSKGYSLAGLRVGLAVGNPDILNVLIKVKDSYNLSTLSIELAAAALADQAYKNACCAKVVVSRTRLKAGLEKLGFYVWPSDSNFLLAKAPNGQARDIYESLKRTGILVRYFNQPRLDDSLRITVGTDEQNAVLLAALKRFLT